MSWDATDRLRRTLAGAHSDPTHRILVAVGVAVVSQLERIAIALETRAQVPPAAADESSINAAGGGRPGDF